MLPRNSRPNAHRRQTPIRTAQRHHNSTAYNSRPRIRRLQNLNVVQGAAQAFFEVIVLSEPAYE
jgi:hypothetical protein